MDVSYEDHPQWTEKHPLGFTDELISSYVDA